MKVAALPRVYMRRCPKVVFKSLVTSHQSLETPNPWPLIPSYSPSPLNPLSPYHFFLRERII